MSDFTFVWSSADTHCVWCGKPEASETEWNREHNDNGHSLEPGAERCWCMNWCWDCDPMDIEEPLTELRGLAEAQAAVIQRFLDGWRHSWGAERDGRWLDRVRGTEEPMTSAEQHVVYGEAVE